MEEAQNKLVEEIVVKIYEKYPDLVEKFGEHGKRKTFEDNIHHFNSLNLAYEANHVEIFVNYTMWLNDVLTTRGVSTEIIIENYNIIVDVIEGKLTKERVAFYNKAIEQAVWSLL
ncbi:hypothetical protein [Alkalihalobacterium alkalinitrilicum]|uniref:hypothetical protein n=1 Tax=Alkalihalobacterium alkalinitrilicum TaxID=427920 RepID=UPI000994D257|nr:hypothetical protein [Alkalihalobacterium alkalinitrilicum]